MRYLTYEKENLEWKPIYCNTHKNETTFEDIIKAITSENFIGKFNKSEHISITKPIKNDDKLYITTDINGNGNYNIWQIGGCFTDMEGFVIPCTYKVRKIGIMFD